MRIPFLLCVLLVLGASPLSAAPAAAVEAAVTAPFPVVVIAHIDTGINPYHAAFRDDGPLAHVHPSQYLAGYPADAPALRLSLDEATWEAAFEKDRAIWESLPRNTLYWIPGTRIVGAISFGSGGTNCPLVAAPPLNVAGGTGCPERVILDDHGHGTMTASRMASAGGSLAPDARIVSIEGLGARSVRWAADAGWIDVQTNSWLSLVPNLPRVDGMPPWLLSDAGAVGQAFRHAASRMVTVAATGNGAGYLGGFVSNPTIAMSTAAPGVLLVGAHDNGRVTTWDGAPAHVVADGYGGLTAARDHLTRFGPDPMSCCTSAAAPYAAGGAAALVLEARRLVGDTGVGLRGDAIAVGAPYGTGPLADGRLTLAEAGDVLRRTAEARPADGAHDGIAHWTGTTDGPSAHALTYGPGANPFCQGCWSTPVEWRALPEGAPTYPEVGFGAVNERSLALAASVLSGAAPLPARDTEQELYALDQAAREPFYPR